jgi:uncharacterized protein
MIGNAVWFEIPASNFERAVKFYEAVFQVALKRQNMMGGDLAVFPGSDTSVNGAVVSQDGYVPAVNGAVVYLNTGDDLTPYLKRAAAHGGSVIEPKTALPPGMGHFAHFGDTEGNRVGLFSDN